MSHDPRIEAACEGFYNDISGMTDWGRLSANDPRLANKYRASMARALAAADQVQPPTVLEGRVALASTNTDEYVLGDDEMLLGIVVPFTRDIKFGGTVTLARRSTVRPLVGTVKQCVRPSCQFMVMFTDSGWLHADTHGQDTSDHTAAPAEDS